MKKTKPFIIMGIALAGIAAAMPTQAATAVLARDSYGVPFIISDSESAGMYAFGYAQAEDRLEALLRNYKQARGETAEIDGPAALQNDVKVRAFRLEEIAQAHYTQLPIEVRRDLTAFCAGVNQFQKENPKACPTWSFAVKPADVVALSEFINLSFANDPAEQSVGVSTSVQTAWRGSAFPAPRFPPQSDPAMVGSNAFVIASGKTEDGVAAIVSMDPHLPWHGLLRWYQGVLHSGPLHVSGVTFLGLPYIVMGHNTHVAWANTVNQPDLSDLYEERLTPPQNPTGYKYDGKVKALVKRTFVFRVKQANGRLQQQSCMLFYTQHGPVVTSPSGRTFAVRKAGWGDVQVLSQIRDQDIAANAAQYRQAVAERHVVLFNHLFADDAGHIGYIYGGQIPRRPAGYDYHKPVPGWVSTAEWKPVLTLSELPQLNDPASNFLVNCNDAPRYVVPLNDAADQAKLNTRWPAWLTPEFQTDRGRRMTQLVSEKSRISSDDAKEIATDVLDLTAESHLPALLQAVQSSTQWSGSDAATLHRCAQILSSWDCRRTVQSIGPALFEAWCADPDIAAIVQKSANAAVSPDPNTAAQALLGAAQQMTALHLPLDVTWGTVHRHRLGRVDLPMDGGGNSLTPNNGPVSQNGVITADFGSSFRMVVELHRDSLQAWSAVPYGESDQPSSPHYTDQMPLAAGRAYRKEIFLPEDVSALLNAAHVFTWNEE